jgi:hypothetical protein
VVNRPSGAPFKVCQWGPEAHAIRRVEIRGLNGRPERTADKASAEIERTGLYFINKLWWKRIHTKPDPWEPGTLNMILPSDSIAVVRNAIRSWVGLLSSGSFEEAARGIATQGAPCSAELLVEAIGRYSRKYRDTPANVSEGLFPRITSPGDMVQHGENMVIYVKDASTVIEYDLPVENSWSDLTAKFRLTEQNDGEAELSLIDIRVL